MEKYIVGYYSSPWNEVSHYIYNDYSISEPIFSDGSDIDNYDELYSHDEILNLWAIALNSPWDGSYDFNSNELDEFELNNGFTYKRVVIGYEMMTGIIYSKELDKDLAINELNNAWTDIQNRFNSENTSF